MSLIKSIRKQLGLSVTPANNFTLTAEADNGTMKLARGNAGETTQDILTVDVSGKVSFPQGTSVVEYGTNANGEYTKFDDGTLIQRGKTASFTTGTGYGAGSLFTGSSTITFPIAFLNTNYTVVGSAVEQTGFGGWGSAAPSTTTTFNASAYSGTGTATAKVSWLAIGRWK